jgi:hypothetical protein
MERAFRFWGQEVDGDARRWGVPGAAPEVRREYLNDFLQHGDRLASVAPGQAGVARAFLARTHTPIANAGWQWPTGLGWTVLSGDQMRHFVSAQTYALRSYAAARAGPDRFGFAWAPNNATGMANSAFVGQSGQLLDRLGAALADSGTEWKLDPGMQACAGVWCLADVEGAAFTPAWRIFSVWADLPRIVPRAFPRLVSTVRRLALRTWARRRR